MQPIKAGYLVSSKTTLCGGVHFTRTEYNKNKEGERAVTKWKTTKVIDSPDEYRRGEEIRNRINYLVYRVCVLTSFGLLCPSKKKKELEEAIAEGAKLARDYNRTARYSRITPYIFWTQILNDNEDNLKALSSEIREMLDTMKDGILNIGKKPLKDSIKEIKKAADKAKRLTEVLDDSYTGKINVAVEEARKAAREITKRVIKKNESIEEVLKSINTKAIAAARFAFIDTNEKEVKEEKAEKKMPAVKIKRMAVEVDAEDVEE